MKIIKEGIEKGIEKEKYFACRNMLRKGFDTETISGVLDVNVDYIDDKYCSEISLDYIFKTSR